jgi:uncharacterized membrane protein
MEVVIDFTWVLLRWERERERESEGGHSISSSMNNQHPWIPLWIIFGLQFYVLVVTAKNDPQNFIAKIHRKMYINSPHNNIILGIYLVLVWFPLVATLPPKGLTNWQWVMDASKSSKQKFSLWLIDWLCSL